MPDDCKVETALEILVGKWKPVILFHKMLTFQLRELEYHDIVHREIYLQIPPKVEYSITEYGKRMTPLLQAMNDWGMAHVEHLNELYGKDRSVESLEVK